uniref:Uncharacterized protein n=1 Tax=Aegilops tauschii subsp. strangulata TaxID=200361 RepID=A0A453ATG1_AEGTS
MLSSSFLRNYNTNMMSVRLSFCGNREYLDVRPDGWLDYAPKRIAQLGAKKCYNRTLCEELLSILLPARPPFHPRQFATCAVVGNSGDLLKTEFGQEIDAHDAVFRDNEAPVNKKYAKYVGLKRDFRLVVRGAARNMAPILKGSSDEALIIKSLTHKEINAVIKELPNPVYLFQGIVLRRGAKGTGMKSVELALSMCDIVDIYGFTVDPGYTEWTRYFSAPRKGHNPLQGRAYYQLLECLGVSLSCPLFLICVNKVIFLHLPLLYADNSDSFPNESTTGGRLVGCAKQRSDQKSACCSFSFEKA